MKKFVLFSLCIAVLFITSGCSCVLTKNIYQITQNGKIGFIDGQGKEVIEDKYDGAILNNCEKLVAVKFNGLWGFIDKNGKFVIIPQYKDTNGFKDGLAYVRDERFEGYINTDGKYIWKQAIVKDKKISEYSTQGTPSKVKNDFADNILKDLGL
jgi:hypothetical protein